MEVRKRLNKTRRNLSKIRKTLLNQDGHKFPMKIYEQNTNKLLDTFYNEDELYEEAMIIMFEDPSVGQEDLERIQKEGMNLDLAVGTVLTGYGTPVYFK